MSHSCIEHGHYCSRCEDEAAEKVRKDEIAATVESWWWNLNIFEIYDSIKDKSEEDQIDLLVHAHSKASYPNVRVSLGELYEHLIGCSIDEPRDYL